MGGMIVRRIVVKTEDVRYVQTCQGCGQEYFYQEKETFLVGTGWFGLGKKVKVSSCSYCSGLNPVPENPVMNIPVSSVKDQS